MNCDGGGNRFVCGIRRYEKHRISTPDKPSNAMLHNENNRKLEELMTERSLQDKGIFIQQYRPPFQQSASNIIQNIPTTINSSSSLQRQEKQHQQHQWQQQQQQHQQIVNKSVSEKINDVSKGERTIDFDTYLNVD